MREHVWNSLARWSAVVLGIIVLACMGPGENRPYTPDPEAVRQYQREREMEERREKYGDTVQFEFVKPEGAKYKIDGREYPVPARAGLRVRSDRAYPIQVKTQDGAVYVGELDVKLTNAGTKMGLVTVKEIDDEKLKKEVSKGQPLHVNFVFLNETVAELRLGNRSEIDDRSVLIVFPGILRELEVLRERAKDKVDEWKLWKSIYGIDEDPEGIEGAQKHFSEGMRHASEGSPAAETAFENAITAYEQVMNLAARKIQDAERLDAARQGYNDASSAWDRWASAWLPKEEPEAIVKGFEASQRAESLAREEGKAADAAKEYEAAAGLYADGLAKAQKDLKEPNLKAAAEEAQAWQKAWTDWKDAPTQPNEIKFAEENLKKADEFAEKKDERKALHFYGRARNDYEKAFKVARQAVRDGKQLARARTASDKYAEAWGAWTEGKNVAETEEIRKANDSRKSAQAHEAASRISEAVKAYWDSADMFMKEIQREKAKGKGQSYDAASVTVDGRNSKIEPPEFNLRQQTGSYNGMIKFEGKTYYLSISVPNVTEFTRVSKIVIWNVTRRTLNQVSGGKPVILTYDLAGTKVLELAIGNRN